MLTLIVDKSGEWIGIYSGDKLIYEGQSIEPARLLKLAGASFKYLESDLGPGAIYPDSLKAYRQRDV